MRALPLGRKNLSIHKGKIATTACRDRDVCRTSSSDLLVTFDDAALRGGNRPRRSEHDQRALRAAFATSENATT
jgi:hypothetical protein